MLFSCYGSTYQKNHCCVPASAAIEVLPDGHAEIIFHFGGNLLLEVQSGPLPSPFLVQLNSRA